MHLIKSNNELSEKAYIDFATTLPNKNKCKEMIASSVSKPTALFMLDLNDLKVTNDTLGHETGDMMILNFAGLLRQIVPSKYFVGRFGGDEFIIIAEGIKSVEDIQQLLKKIQDAIIKFNESNREYQLSYACGYAYSREYPGCSREVLLNLADKKMYENKEEIKSTLNKKLRNIRSE